eukprot:6045472-Pyramimonas_sp.AAC.1
MEMRARPASAVHLRSHSHQSSRVYASLTSRDPEWSGAEDPPQIPHHPDMSWRPTSRSTTARE